jgi:glucosamine--fructose-6-phosphate aminotransferase (isomerizing)
MCGIVAYVGQRNALDVLLNGLKRVEYRGYDSAGVAILQDGHLSLVKTAGKVGDLVQRVGETWPVQGSWPSYTMGSSRTMPP